MPADYVECQDLGDEDDAERLEVLSACDGDDEEFWMLITRLMSRRFQIEADEAFGFFRDNGVQPYRDLQTAPPMTYPSD